MKHKVICSLFWFWGHSTWPGEHLFLMLSRLHYVRTYMVYRMVQYC